VLGQTWVGHYGTNHKQSTRIALVPDKASHPILRGVKDVWVQAGGYVGKPTSGEILTMAQPLNGMTPDSPCRHHKAADAERVDPQLQIGLRQRRPRFHLAVWHIGGHHERRLSPPARERHLLGARFGRRDQADLNIAFVGAAKPNTFGGGAYARGIKPEMYAGFTSPIPANNNTTGPAKPKKEEKQAAAASIEAKPSVATGKPARYVRIEIPGEKKCLQIAEIEVLSGGKNIAKGGKATQSTTTNGGDAGKALDGDKNPAWGKGMTHTKENQPNPWWEVDLGSAQNVDTIALWSRSGFSDRLGDFTLQLLDEVRKPVFELKNIAGPEAMTIDVKGGGKLAYLTFDGKPGKPAVKGSGGGKSSGPPEPPLADVPADYKDPMPFAFNKGDVVAILGNGLPDRMQHDGWMETLLQSALPELNVRFRNMSTSGDRPNSYPRSPGQISMTTYLQHVKADVVFGFFGYNESFENKPDDYQKLLVDFVKKTRGTKANGKSFPRIVLFSPIAHEATGNVNVPDGKAHNAQLEAYTKATEAAAKEAGVAFVDLFHPSQELFKAAKEPLTINGVHLTPDGNRQLAEVIAKGLLGKQVSASPSMEALREAVVDKSYHWYQRYHASDGNDVWGSRSTLAFFNDQTNGVVLQHELSMLDVMTMNRDERVWARINGGDKKIDDSNVPKPIPVISNVGGGSKSSSAQKEGVLRYISGEEAIKHMAVKKGFEVHLFADEAQFPELANPVQMQFDTKGRLWVAAWSDYPKWEPLKESKDALIILHDDNNDGKADRMTEFAKVNNPLGFEFWNGGVLVTRQSELLFLKDTDGDDKADVQTIMLQGLDSSDTHHGANNLIYGPDGGVYWQSGVFMQHNHEHPWGPSLNATASAMYRLDPRRFTISLHAMNSPNPHGTSFDAWGYQYATDGTGGRAYQVRPEGSGFKMYELLKKEVRPVTASEVVSSTHFPEDMQGDFLICNVIGFLGVKHYDLARDSDKGTVWGEPAGEELTVKVTQADGTVTEEKSTGFLMSGDKNFRPSDAVFAPDGSLYLADWHNVIIGHMQHNVRDPNRDHKHGRVYRITATGRPLQKIVPIDGQPIPALLENLKHPTNGVRHLTHIELSERDSKEVIAATQEWMKQFDPKKKEDAHPLLEALWIHQQHNVRNTQLLAMVQQSPELHARNAANTVQHLWFNVEASMHGGVIAAEAEEKAKKSGILSDTPELTTIRIATVPERMMYDVKELTVKAGKKIKLTFANPDFMPHNILLVNNGKVDDIANKALVMGAKGFETGFIPESPDIIWASKLLDNGKEQVIEFTAPAKPGDYPYMCSFPGHSILMRGMMHVK
jgi:putative membrane-bound dehydrogenase-like protein